jgi:hypothetical protein
LTELDRNGSLQHQRGTPVRITLVAEAQDQPLLQVWPYQLIDTRWGIQLRMVPAHERLVLI